VSEPPRAPDEQRAEGDPDPQPAAPDPDRLSRLDPDAASPAVAPEPGSAVPGRLGKTAAPIDTRRYRWMIGIIGLVLVVAISIYQFATHGVGTTGVPAGQRLHLFAAPLADTNLIGDPNLRPPCSQARHDRRALNICLELKRAPLVLAFFVTGSPECRRSVDALQALSRRVDPRAVQFAAVAVRGSRADTAGLVRSHRWTIPVAYDRDGSVGGLYGVAICPMLELAYRGGIVKDRLIGDRWQTTSAIGPRVRALIRAGPGAP
jgi:hypothetical protein